MNTSEIAERAAICKNCRTPITQVQRFQDTSSRWIIQWEHPHGVVCKGLRAEPGERAIEESRGQHKADTLFSVFCGGKLTAKIDWAAWQRVAEYVNRLPDPPKGNENV